jgi:uncharacterized membrane protein
MNAYVFTLLLGTACLHAGWNVKMKRLELEPFTKGTLFSTGTALVGSGFFLAGLPAPEAYPYLIAGAIFNSGYITLLMHAYHFGPVSQVYPVVRGASVLIIAFLTAVIPREALFSNGILNDELSFLSWLGVAGTASGVILLCSPVAGELVVLNRRTASYALLTALCLSLGQLADASGARVSGNVYGYLAASFLLQCIPTITVAFVCARHHILHDMRREWKAGLQSGVMAVASYSVAIWAMTLAVIPKVSAVRETSVLITTFIAIYKGEPFKLVRVIASFLVFGGLVLIRMF